MSGIFETPDRKTNMLSVDFPTREVFAVQWVDTKRQIQLLSFFTLKSAERHAKGYKTSQITHLFPNGTARVLT
jgi:hypothetical protein